MRKIKLCLAIILSLILLLTSCDILLPDVTTEPECVMHVWSDYKYNYRGHWREYTCGCPWPEIFEEHINYDADLMCDVCGAYYECDFIDEDKNGICDICGVESSKLVWKYTDTYHWMVYECHRGFMAPDVVINEGEHVDKDKDSFCDACNYKLK